MDEWITALTVASVVPAVVSVIATWLKLRAARRQDVGLSITIDDKTVHITGNSDPAQIAMVFRELGSTVVAADHARIIGRVADKAVES